MQKDLNFFSVYKKPIDAQGSVDKVTFVGIIVLTAAAVLIAGAALFLWGADKANQAASAGIRQYLRQADVVSAEGRYDTALNKNGQLSAYKQEAQKNADAFKKMPTLTSRLLSELAKYQPADVSVTEVDYTSGSVTLKCTSAAQSSAATFVHSIKTANIFSGVTYSGVTQTGGTFSFTIDCVMKGGDGK